MTGLVLLCLLAFFSVALAVEVKYEGVETISGDASVCEDADFIQLFVESIEVGDPSRTHWDCIDGRADHPIFGTPGGDMGEFVLAMQTWNNNGADCRDDYCIQKAFKGFVDTLPAGRQFYVHTDTHVVGLVMEEFRRKFKLDKEEEFDIRSVPPQYRQAALGVLVKPEFIGCGHLKFMMLHSEEYGVELEVIEASLRAYFRRLWTDKNNSVVLEILEGEHEEKGIFLVNVETDTPNALYRLPRLLPHPEEGVSALVKHDTGIEFLRRRLASFCEVNRPTVGVDMFVEKVNEHGAKVTILTVGYLAPTLSICQLNFKVEEEHPVETFTTHRVRSTSEESSSAFFLFPSFFASFLGLLFVILFN